MFFLISPINIVVSFSNHSYHSFLYIWTVNVQLLLYDLSSYFNYIWSYKTLIQARLLSLES